MKRMMRTALALCLMLGGLAAAQDMGAYTDIKIKHAGQMEGTGGGSFRIDSLTGGVELLLIAKDPAAPPLPIRAQSMKFEYAEGASNPKKIVMEGDVEINHPDGKATAQKAVWDWESGSITFTGNPEMSTKDISGIKGDPLVYNIKTKRFSGKSLSTAGGISLMGLGGNKGADAGASGGLTESDITDWPGFINALKAEMKSEEPSPGKRLVSKLEPDLQSALKTMETEALVGQKKMLLKKLNGLLPKPGLYTREAYAKVTLDDATKALVDKETKTPEEQAKQNRSLLEAAYPNFIKKP